MSADATLWSSEAWASTPDPYLLARARDGSAEAFGELWRRHLPAAYAVAGRHRGRSAPEDIVAEAAARVLALIREGKGPHEHFRAYFLTAVRSVAIDQGRRDLRAVPTEPDDLEDLADPADDPFEGLATDDEGLALVRAAFAGLSERDQRVLWHTTVEGSAPRAVAPALGMTANAVSVRAMRARESLRALYLDARAERGLSAADGDECRWTVSHLGALVRGRLPRKQRERAELHVSRCPHAAAIAADLRVIHDGFPALIVPVVLLAGLGTPGFVSAAAVVGLAGGPGAVGPAGAVGGAAPGSPGVVHPAPSSTSSLPGGAGLDAVTQAASRVTGLVAGLAVTAGVAGALALPGASLAAPSSVAAAPPSTSSTAPGAPAAPGASLQPVATRGPVTPADPSAEVVLAPAVPSPAVSTGRPEAGLTRAAPTTSATATGTPRPQEPLPTGGGVEPTRSALPSRPTAQLTTPPVSPLPAPPTTKPPATKPPTSRPPTPAPTPPAPTTTPPAPQPGGVAPAITVRLVSGQDPARISVRVRSGLEGSMTVRVTNLSGSGALTVRNSSWSCTQAAPSAVRCAGGRGQALLEQSGTGAVQPVVVRVTDAAGSTWTETVRPS